MSGLLSLAAAAVLLVPSAAIAQTAGAENPDNDLVAANKALQHGAYQQAAQMFARANKKRQNRCVECYLGAATAQHRLGNGKKALQSLDRALSQSDATARQRSHAYALRGVILLEDAGKRGHKLQEAEQAFRAALESDPENKVLLYNLGKVVLRQGRESEGIGLLSQLVEALPSHPLGVMARRVIRKPHLATAILAPEFTVVTLEGEQLSLSQLEGNVVLLDFWATWCPPCVDAVRDLRYLRKRYRDKPVVIVSISWDRESEKWKQFIARNNMDWTHTLDSQNEVGQLFAVRAIPSYFVIDSDGAIRRKIEGGGRFDAALIDNEIGRLLREMTAQAGK